MWFENTGMGMASLSIDRIQMIQQGSNPRRGPAFSLSCAGWSRDGGLDGGLQTHFS